MPAICGRQYRGGCERTATPFTLYSQYIRAASHLWTGSHEIVFFALSQKCPPGEVALLLRGQRGKVLSLREAAHRPGTFPCLIYFCPSISAGWEILGDSNSLFVEGWVMPLREMESPVRSAADLPNPCYVLFGAKKDQNAHNIATHPRSPTHKSIPAGRTVPASEMRLLARRLNAPRTQPGPHTPRCCAGAPSWLHCQTINGAEYHPG
jgi:hypothetical protein